MSNHNNEIHYGAIKFTKGKPINLLAQEEGFEVMTFSFEVGMKLNFHTKCHEKQFSFFILQSGKLVSHDGQSVLLPGDYFYAEQFSESHVLYNAEVDSLVLGITSKDNSFTDISERLDKQKLILEQIQLKDNYTYEHCRRVYHLCFLLAKEFDLSPDNMRNLLLAAYYHDIGKLSIPDHILNKSGKLNAAEYEIIKGHVKDNNEILNTLKELKIYDIAIQHHERNDGSGYPNQLTSDDILFESKILCVTDSYDAMTTDRVYKKGKSQEEALIELKLLCPKHYDLVIVEALERVINTPLNKD